MSDHEHIFRELRTSMAEALQRSEERMSHVQRQLAGWQEPLPTPAPLSDHSEGWDDLQAKASQIAEDVDQELSQVEASLAELVHQGRQWKTKLSRK